MSPRARVCPASQGRWAEAGVRCVVFGERVLEGDAVGLSGDPARAEPDIIELGERLGVLVRGA